MNDIPHGRSNGRPIVTLADASAVASGLDHLRAADPIIARLIDQVGPFRLTLERRRFRMLARSIIWQQISTSAAQSIWRRLEELAGAITPEKLAPLTTAQLRSAGVSPQKSAYLLDLTSKVLNGQVRFRSLSRLSDQQVVDELVQVKGIGEWTAQMFLIFSLGRLDVFPLADLGIRNALRNLYRLQNLPEKADSVRIAEPWRPYATLASWYCWRSLGAPAQPPRQG